MFSKVPSCAFSGFWTLTLKLTHHFDLIYNIGKSDWNILQNIMKTAQDSYTITIKQIVRFQERMHFEKFQVDKIQNGRWRPLFTSTGLILRNIMKTAQDSYTITIKQIVSFQESMHLKKFKSIKFKMATYRPLFTSTGLILRNIMKTAQDSNTITIKQIVRFQLDQVQNGRLLAIIHLDRPDIG